jgi:hypothetical protein
MAYLVKIFLEKVTNLKKKEPKGNNHCLSLEVIKHSFILVDDVHEAHL